MKAITHTKSTVKPLRFALSLDALRRPTTHDSAEITRHYMTARKKERNHITINTKNIRPVFIPRENPDMPPVITAHVRELAIFTRNCNTLKAHFIVPELDMSITADANDEPVFLKRIGKIHEATHDTPRPLWVCASAPVKGKQFGRIYTEYSNIRPEDKPAFRRDGDFLFDTLSEDYNA